MTYSPISGTPPQYQKRSDGTLASDYWLKFYQAGTSTPLSAATDPSAVTLLAKIKLNDGGYPISNPLDNETVFIPYLNQDYKIVLFKSETDADNNTTANADFVIDDVQLEIPVLATSDSAISARGTTQQALNDYDRSPLFVHGTDFTAGAPPHVITAPAGWTPSASGMRFWKMSAAGLVYELAVSGTSSTTFTVSESLLSTDTLFLGDDIVRFGTVVPTGGIIMYTGTYAPYGWAFCDGTNGTPDLRNSFIKGKATIGATSATGGSENITPAGSITVDNHVLTEAEIPAHTHDVAITGGYSQTTSGTAFESGTVDYTNTYASTSTGGGTGHNHTGSFTGSSQNNEPVFYTLAYIMKL